MRKLVVCMLLALSVVIENSEASVLDWVWGHEKSESTVLVADGVPLVSIPYESMTDDEKFLQEAAKFTEIQVSSPLETCQHKVIMKIKTSCSDMTEEQLAKLSVNLLNCQSAVEGRKMFPCNDEMSLKQCTTDMDADMWNAYHLMSNRARAVCYTARSTQFRALTELTVNKLMSTTHSQIQTLASLKEGQERLEEQTTQALSSLSEGNKALLQQQETLKNAQTTAHQLVTTNLRELVNERALIRSGHAQLAAMAEDIRRKLEEANENLLKQAEESGQNHREVLEDLIRIQEHAQDIWDKIESSTNRIFKQQEQALDQYEQTLGKLIQINDTVHFVWNVTNTMRTELDQKLSWITSYIGDTGEQVHKLWRSFLHVVYIMVAMIFAAFLQAPFSTRVSILCIVPMNLICFLKHGSEACLDFASITILIILITTMHYLMTSIQQILNPQEKIQNTTTINNKIRTENEEMNGAANFLRRSPSKSFPSSIISKAVQNIRDFLSIVMYKSRELFITCKNAIVSGLAWTKRDVVHSEELSCSYIPSRKNRNDVYEYAGDMGSISEDITDFEVSREANRNYFSDDDYDHLIDAEHLRRRANRFQRSSSRASTRASNTSFISGSTRIPCKATTKAGKGCRLYATAGQEYCGRHLLDASLLSTNQD